MPLESGAPVAGRLCLAARQYFAQPFSPSPTGAEKAAKWWNKVFGEPLNTARVRALPNQMHGSGVLGVRRRLQDVSFGSHRRV
jgi:hypothetical protein